MIKNKLFPILAIASFMMFAVAAPTLSTETGGNTDVGFKYGIIGKKSMQDRKLFLVEDGGEMHASEMIRINYSLVKPGYFYLIWGASGGDFALLTVFEKTAGEETPGDIQKTDWYELDSECGTETLYLIASPERLLNLEKLFNDLTTNDKKSQSEINRKIALELEYYQKDSGDAGSRLATRKERPIDGGIVFRSAGINENTIQHELTGTGVQVKAIKIDHRK